jgi:ABC-type multidrug transport system fused ATPase/permease subunit
MAGARDRKRAERQKRKRRSTERPPASVEAPDESSEVAVESNGSGAATETFQEKMSRRYEERNAEARAKLEPLEEGERPTAVTVGAIASAVLAIVFTVSAVLAIAGVEAGGREIKPLPIIVFGAVLWAMTVGMWRSRYWAVLGFQTVLLLVMLASAFGLVVVASVLQAVGTTLLLAGSATLFYFMIRAMARIQMPSPPGDL